MIYYEHMFFNIDDQKLSGDYYVEKTFVVLSP